VPWAEGDNIPWHDPEFSRRMLAEHLTQAHDLASRRFETIDRQVDWIHRSLLSREPTKILDLGCGPGFYSGRLAAHGHECVGIDYSPASIAHARQHAEVDQLACTYVQDDIRTADYGDGFGLVMLIYGEFNVFAPADARRILRKAQAALKPGGVMLIEPHTADAIREKGGKENSWYSCEQGLFSDRPHMCLTEHHWNAANACVTDRYYVIDAADSDVTRYAASYQSYTDEQYRAVLEECGFSGITFVPTLTGNDDNAQRELIGIIAGRDCASESPNSPKEKNHDPA
jgi:SAM-dependent methyltransferase